MQSGFDKKISALRDLKADVNELLTLWLSDQMYAVVKDEQLTNEEIQVTEEKNKFKKSKRK